MYILSVLYSVSRVTVLSSVRWNGLEHLNVSRTCTLSKAVRSVRVNIFLLFTFIFNKHDNAWIVRRSAFCWIGKINELFFLNEVKIIHFKTMASPKWFIQEWRNDDIHLVDVGKKKMNASYWGKECDLIKFNMYVSKCLYGFIKFYIYVTKCLYGFFKFNIYVSKCLYCCIKCHIYVTKCFMALLNFTFV